MAEIETTIIGARAEERSMTVRQVFYRLVSAAVIEKTELQYLAVVRILTDMAHGARFLSPQSPTTPVGCTSPARTPTSRPPFDGSFKATAATPRQTQPRYVEAWLEKDALAGGATQ